MPSRDEISYFGAGPAPLPTPVLEAASKALLNYNDSGIGLSEISHRSTEATQILEDAKTALRTLLDIPDTYEILFMHGGGSGQFSAVVCHMVAVWIHKQRLLCEKIWHGTPLEKEDEDVKLREFKAIVARSLRLDYLVTGSWSLKASQEAARLVGPEHVHVALDSRDHNKGKFGVIPSEATWRVKRPFVESVGHQIQQSAFTYYCDNETVDGVEFPGFPHILEPVNAEDDRLVIADMSSNFLSRKFDIRKYAAVYAGAQKNVGSTGITIVMVRKSLLPPHATLASPTLLRALGLPIAPVVFDWSTISKNNSLYNTLPIFDVWIASEVMRTLVEKHGAKKISGQEQVCDEKARILYEALDKASNVYRIVPSKEARSRMNICLRLVAGDDAEKSWLKQAESLGLKGLKGHRSVGGIRISNYNAVTVDSVRKLAEFITKYAETSST